MTINKKNVWGIKSFKVQFQNVSIMHEAVTASARHSPFNKHICNRQYNNKYPTKRTDHKRLHTFFGITFNSPRLKTVRQFMTSTVTVQFRPVTSYIITNITHTLRCIHVLYIHNQEGKFKANLTPF
jgi:hypothetical protein